MNTRERGYTLTEIIVAVAVIAVLAGAMTPLIFKQIDKSRSSRVKQDLNAIKAAFIQYYADTQFWPCGWTGAAGSGDKQGNLTSFNCLYETDKKNGWDGPYLNESAGANSSGKIAMAIYSSGAWSGVVDPWGNPYQIYRVDAGSTGAAAGAIVIYSEGKDRKTDTSTTNLLTGNATDDDIVMIVTTRADD